PVHPDSEGPELVRHPVEEVEGERATGRDKLLDPEVLDLLLVRDPQGLLDLDLDREAVHVVARLISDVVAAHPAEAEDRVLRRLVQHLAQVDRSGRERRPVAEVEILSLRTRLDRLRVNLRAVPELLDLLLHLEWSIRFLRLLDHRSPAPRDSDHREASSSPRSGDPPIRHSLLKRAESVPPRVRRDRGKRAGSEI